MERDDSLNIQNDFFNQARKDKARQEIETACRKFLTNPVIEDFHLEIAD